MSICLILLHPPVSRITRNRYQRIIYYNYIIFFIFKKGVEADVEVAYLALDYFQKQSSCLCSGRLKSDLIFSVLQLKLVAFSVRCSLAPNKAWQAGHGFRSTRCNAAVPTVIWRKHIATNSAACVHGGAIERAAVVKSNSREKSNGRGTDICDCNSPIIRCTVPPAHAK